MIFIVLVAFIALIVMSLNMLDNSNLEKIKSYLEAKNCTQMSYGYGSYKALCQEKIVMIENSFSLDIAKNQKEMSQDEIINKQLKNQKLILTLNDQTQVVLEFKQKEDAQQFYEKIQEKR